MVNQGSLLHSQDQYRYTVFVSKSNTLVAMALVAMALVAMTLVAMALVAMALVAMALGVKISPLLVQMEVG